MHLSSYNKIYKDVFESAQIHHSIETSLEMISSCERIFFIGNGGSNSIASHMMEDFGKMARKQTFAFSDPALITCYANDYGYENAIAEWLKLHVKKNDMLVAISSSGNSKNILNAVEMFKKTSPNVLTCTGFEEENPLRRLGKINFYIPSKSYGEVECFHQVYLHIILDEFCQQNIK